MTRAPDERWVAIDAAVQRQREQRVAQPYLCGELFTDRAGSGPDPPARRFVVNCIGDIADYKPSQ